MKLVIRADDVGYTELGNIGTFRAIDSNIVCNADVMLDCPGTEDALRKLKERPWVSIGWHSPHYWGKPVTEPKYVRSLIDNRGFFKWACKNGPDRAYGTDVTYIKNSVKYEEMVLEFRNQIERCIRIAGRIPVTTSGYTPLYTPDGKLIHNKVDDAKIQVCEEFGIAWSWYRKEPDRRNPNGLPCNPKYAYANAILGSLPSKHASLRLPPKDQPEIYDLVRAFEESTPWLMEREVFEVAFHPAYLDNYIMFDGGFDIDTARIRVMDVYQLTRPELRQWVAEHDVTLVNTHDVLYGTQDFQNHLKVIGSSMCKI